MTDDELLAMCWTELAYLDAQLKGEAGVVAITRLMYTHAILAEIHPWGYERRWCYHSYDAARAALDAWDGTGEPDGWHRDPVTGRRRDLDGRVYVDR